MKKPQKSDFPIKRVPLVKTRHYTEVEKIRAVSISISGMSNKVVEEMTGIPSETIKWWKTQPWWFDCVQLIHKEQDEEIVTNFSKIVQKAQKQVEDRIEKGDWVYLKMGKDRYEKQRLELKARDLSTIAVQSIDKRQLLLDRPTSRTEKITVKERLSNLADEFKKFAAAKTVDAEVISEEK